MAEQRLIDAEALKYSIIKRLVDSRNSKKHGKIKQLFDSKASEKHGALEIVGECIDNATTVDAKPVVHAHWVIFGKDGTDTDYGCTNCGYTFTTSGSYPQSVHYCPYCGAQMDEEEG